MKRILGKCMAVISLSVLLCGYNIFMMSSAGADEKTEAIQLVDKSLLTLQSFMKDNYMGVMRDLLKDAKGVFIMPQLLQGGFIVGASGGSGLFVARDENGKWNGPVFYTIGGASIGLQIGGQSSEVILLVMTDRGAAAFQSTNFKLGADAGIAVGPFGVGLAAQTANLSADILSFSRSMGLYGGVSLQGAVAAVRTGLNKAYYGRDINPSDVLIRPTVRYSQAVKLLEEVARAAKKK